MTSSKNVKSTVFSMYVVPTYTMRAGELYSKNHISLCTNLFVILFWRYKYFLLVIIIIIIIIIIRTDTQKPAQSQLEAGKLMLLLYLVMRSTSLISDPFCWLGLVWPSGVGGGSHIGHLVHTPALILKVIVCVFVCAFVCARGVTWSRCQLWRLGGIQQRWQGFVGARLDAAQMSYITDSRVQVRGNSQSVWV